MGKRTVVFVSNRLGLGGTEKGLVLFAAGLDRSRWDVRAVGALGGGEREEQLRVAGIPTACADGDEARLAELLSGADVVHVFRHGTAEPLVPAAVRRAGVPVLVEANVFGHVDRSPDERRFACHLFMSRMCLLRYREWVGGEDFYRRHRVLHFPIGLAELRERAPDPQEAKRRLGLDPDRPVVGRVGRAADLKWRDLIVDMVPPLLELAPEAQVLLVGATPAKERRLRRAGVRERCVLAPAVVDPDRVATYYAACDVFASAAEIGESQGLGLAEAMALGIPVVTSSTPWVDNAQVEFVEHGVAGYLASHPRPFAEAVASLLHDEGRRRRFGDAARARIEDLLDEPRLFGQLERLYEALLAGEGPPEEWSPGVAECEEFAARYPALAAAEYRPLSRREALEVRLTRRRERARQLRSQIVPTLRRLPATLRASR